MQLFDIALKGLRRRRGRMLLLVFSLAIGVATVVALVAVTRTMHESVAARLDEYGANIVVVPQSNALALSYGGITVGSASYDVGQLTLADLEPIGRIKNARNVSVVAPKLLSAVDVSAADGGAADGGPQKALMAGVRFPDEIRLKQWWDVRGVYPALTDEALLGSRLAETLGVAPGSHLAVDGRTLEVVGVLEENGSQDDDILFVDLTLAQEVAGQPGAINLVEVAALCSDCPIEEMVAQIGEALPTARVTAMRQAVTLRMETVGQLTRFAVAVSAVVTVIGSLVVLMTMLGSVAERRQEIGLFRALGYRQRHIQHVVLGEALLVSLSGGLIGWLVGMGAVSVVQPSIAALSSPARWDPLLAAGAIAGTILVGLSGSLYPALRASRLDPTTALRTV